MTGSLWAQGSFMRQSSQAMHLTFGVQAKVWQWLEWSPQVPFRNPKWKARAITSVDTCPTYRALNQCIIMPQYWIFLYEIKYRTTMDCSQFSDVYTQSINARVRPARQTMWRCDFPGCLVCRGSSTGVYVCSHAVAPKTRSAILFLFSLSSGNVSSSYPLD